jgi:hypothetical protein
VLCQYNGRKKETARCFKGSKTLSIDYTGKKIIKTTQEILNG